MPPPTRGRTMNEEELLPAEPSISVAEDGIESETSQQFEMQGEDLDNNDADSTVVCSLFRGTFALVSG